ncbi:beta-ketoacyl synthase N-terminal-like domain-containing protein [Paenibacillus sp. FSL K6-1096]|uniref:beta-ketoacyl synthase N-terminal-like domain-containing protein n=1 Tax=Paenibacillus sp. FSL K6-1096 TaxID=2921460 RepID=UPI0030EDA4F2
MVFKMNTQGYISDSFTIAEKKSATEDIAIIGLSAAIGACETYHEFWSELEKGTDLIGPIPHIRKEALQPVLERGGLDDTQFKTIAYLPRIDPFDYQFFKYSPKEASYIDPAQRIFMQQALGAIEDAGYGGERLRGSKTGIYVGYADSQAYSYQRLTNVLDPEAIYQYPTAHLTSMIPGRIAYFLDLKGPAVVIDTACSSSLVAVHYACQALRRGECETALCGGIKLHIIPLKNELHLGIESPGGRARTFDDEADGTGGGEGSVALLLKPLSQAVSDRDHIYAVIKGTSVNQDGTSVGITAPNVFSQEEVIVRAWEDAGIDPETIGYIETHGTGTRLGDPIEIRAIEKAFARYTSRKQFCGVGALKSNTGHLDHAAGIAGLVKAVLSLKHQRLPANLHFSTPNRDIAFMDSPVYVIDRLRPWISRDGQPRRCGVSSFGLSGTNCHVVLEEAGDTEEDSGESSPPYLFAASAKSKESLLTLLSRYIDYLEANCSLSAADVCYTATAGRGHYGHRMIVMVNNLADLTDKLRLIVGEPDRSREEIGIYTTLSGNSAHTPYYAYLDPAILDCSMDRLSHESARELCELYIAGMDLDWLQLYRNARCHTVSLPTYAFEPASCWVQPVGAAEVKDDMSLYSRLWEPCPGNVQAETLEGDVLIFCQHWDSGSQTAALFSGYCKDPVIIRYGAGYQQLGPIDYIIDGSEEDFDRCFSEISRLGKTFRHLFYFNDFGHEVDLHAEMAAGLYARLNLLPQLVKSIHKHLDVAGTHFRLITRQAHQVNGEDHELNPANALMVSLLKAMMAEHSSLHVQSLDIGTSEVSRIIPMELLTGYDNHIHLAYRNDIRYKEVIASLHPSEIEEDQTQIRSNGVYVVTGGTGKVGLELASYLTSRQAVRIIILQRTLPDSIVGTVTEQPGNRDKLDRLRQLAANGSTIEIMQTDVTQEADVRLALDRIRNKYGMIHGVIHAAGAGIGERGSCLLIDEDPVNVVAMLAPKMNGALLLDKYTREDSLDFMLLCSSAITLVGGIYAGKYLAANAFLDAFAEQRNLNGRKTISINWPVWVTEPDADSGADNNQLFMGIRPPAAKRSLHQVLNRKISHAVLGKFNWTSSIHLISETLPYTLSGRMSTRLANARRHSSEVDKPSEQTVILSGKESFTETEQLVAGIWASLLGHPVIDVNESFSVLGGDSILMVRLGMELEKLGLLEDGVALIHDPTVAGLAEHIDERSRQADVLRR